MTYPSTTPPPRPPKKNRGLWWKIPLTAIAAFVVLAAIVAETSNPRPETASTPTVPEAGPPPTVVVPPAVVKATTAAPPAGGVPGEGTFPVPGEVTPGTYKSDGPDRGGVIPMCYWARLSGTSGELGEVIANGNTEGPVTVTIRKTDKAFQSRGCLPWRKTG